MKTFILLILLILASLTINVKAHDETMTINWNPVTQYTDNTEIATGDLTHYNLYCNGEYPIKIISPDVSYSTMLPHGTYNCYVTAVVTINTIEYESGQSNITVKVIEGEIILNPKPPVIKDH